MNSSLNEMLTSVMERVQTMTDSNTVIGKPITAGETTIIPVSRIHVGLAGGGSDFNTKNTRDNFGGGMGCGVDIQPVAFLMIQNGTVRMLPVAEPASTSVDRLIDAAPELLDKASDFITANFNKKSVEQV